MRNLLHKITLLKTIKFLILTLSPVLTLVLTPALANAAEPEQSGCTALSAMQLPNTTITLAEIVGAGEFTLEGTNNQVFENLPAFCRVTATLRPTADSNINIELWLPLAQLPENQSPQNQSPQNQSPQNHSPQNQWNGKFLAVGNGAFTGNIRHTAMIDPLLRGYATSSTDTGHEGNTASFGLGHPEKVIDFGWRSVHEMTEAAKLLITTYYSTAPRYSYWNGCSAGGRQAMQQAQRFPTDFDGIIAGAPGLDWTGRAAAALRVAKTLEANPAMQLGATERQLLHAAALNSCDANDGVKDGVIDMPAQCRLDPAALQCSADVSQACLTPSQVSAAKLIYSTATNPATGREIAGLLPGSEAGWTELGWTQSARDTGNEQFKYLVYGDPNWALGDFNFETDIVKAEQDDNNTLNALSTDLNAFFANGGKLLQYHGWSDPQISPANSTQYYLNVVDEFGGRDEIHDDYRLFMVPGMGHCGGGPGTDSFDAVTALEVWVEQGMAPDSIIAEHRTQGVVDRSRPLCPFPEVATYTGTGSSDAAENFVCKAP